MDEKRIAPRLEEENEVTLADMQRSKDIVIDNLRLTNALLS